ncbi:MAG: hypothetical protein ACR2O4_10610 [Hyphomicrobiaceae bacterium]
MRLTVSFLAIAVALTVLPEVRVAGAQDGDASALLTVEKTIRRLRGGNDSVLIASAELPARPKLWKQPEILLPRKAETFRTALRDVVALAVCDGNRAAVGLLTEMVRSLDDLMFSEVEAVFLDHRASELWINQIFTVRTRRSLALIQNPAHRPKPVLDVQEALDKGQVKRALAKIPSFSELCPS